MKPIPLTPETEVIARRLVWFEPPAIALADPVRFMAYAMARATHTDMRTLRNYVSDDDFVEALENAPPGIIDPRSWAYWNSKMGRWPPPQMPVRFPAATQREFNLCSQSVIQSPCSMTPTMNAKDLR